MGRREADDNGSLAPQVQRTCGQQSTSISFPMALSHQGQGKYAKMKENENYKMTKEGIKFFWIFWKPYL